MNLDRILLLLIEEISSIQAKTVREAVHAELDENLPVLVKRAICDRDAMLSTDDVRTLLRVGNLTIQQARESGALKASLVGGAWRYKRSDVEAWQMTLGTPAKDVGRQPEPDQLRGRERGRHRNADPENE